MTAAPGRAAGENEESGRRFPPGLAAGAGRPNGCPADRRHTPLRYSATAYFVNAPPAKRSELGPSAANTLPSASTATPSPAAPW